MQKTTPPAITIIAIPPNEIKSPNSDQMSGPPSGGVGRVVSVKAVVSVFTIRAFDVQHIIGASGS